MLDAEIRISVDVDMPAPPGLRYICDRGPAIRRSRAGMGFLYLDAKGRRVANVDTLKRIRSLVIPPAWTDVWICAAADGHIQATGRDAKGRKQYKYHAEYREAREQSKYEHLFAFAAALPTIRATVAEHMSLRGLPREKVLATVVHLLETTLIRVGDDEYARNNQSYGLTTLKSDHVAVEGSVVRFQFTGKSGKQWSLATRDRRVARMVRACQELPGQDLLQYFDDEKALHAVSSGDVNVYLKDITGRTPVLRHALSSAGEGPCRRRAFVALTPNPSPRGKGEPGTSHQMQRAPFPSPSGRRWCDRASTGYGAG
jgi:DNA topoisomerase-1